ncbi:hypothetical protein H4J57_05575 [Colwellia sp. BRX8-7]|uniref:hypothetical protein n=1 Tax=Colwellia sp. BRX8-7 TaxID=2759833 RepID=UPI0015F62414|nr:hypothetical protein [Colwellia sp. BRX8-7]MBA6336669.1 hypothetical protein [Colwellia sp. BRX8-7]
MINIERLCVEQALIVKSNSARRQLADLCKNGIPIDHPLSGFTIQVEWKKELIKKIIQTLLMPLVIFLLLLTLPIAYMFNIWTFHRKKRDLEKEIKLCDLNFEGTNNLNIKTVESLWELHGLDDNKYTLDECIDLLSKWIKILYGADLAMNINIRQRVDTIAANRIELNRAYYENESDGIHFHFAPIFPSIIVLISNELSAYAPED